MVAAVVVCRQLALAVDRAAELAAPDDQRVVEQAALLQVLDQRRRRADRCRWHCPAICLGRLSCWSQPRWKSWMKRTPRSASRRASRQLAANVPGLRDVRAVQLEDALGLLREVGQLGHGGLHPKRHLVLRDARGDLRIAELFELQLVQLAPDRRASGGARRCRSPSGFDRYSTGSPTGAELHALILASAGSRCPTAGRRAADRSGRRCPARSSRRTPAGPGSRCPGRRTPTSRCSAGRRAGAPVWKNVIAGS